MQTLKNSFKEKLNTLSHKINKERLYKSIFVSTCAILVLVSIYHLYFGRKIIPGVYIGKISVGGMTYTKAKQVLKTVDTQTPKDLTLKYKDYSYTIKASDIELQYNIDSSITRAFEVGRTGNLYIDTKDKIAGIFKALPVKAFYDFQDSELSKKFSSIKGELNILGRNASFEIKGDRIGIVPEEQGQKVNEQALYNTVITSYDNMDFSDKELAVSKQDPDITENELTSLLGQAEKIVFNPLKITYQSKFWNLEPKQKVDLLDIHKSSKIKLTLNGPKFEAYVQSLEQEVNKLPKGQVTQLDGNKVVNFELTESGIELNNRKFTRDFENAFLESKANVEIPINELKGPDDAAKYGIYSLLGEGKSKFAGSIPGRIHNLTLAARRISGVLVPPGNTFSFNKTVGEISGRTGYDSAYIISQGRTVLGEGGGVCQTSTTLFRAILNAGLPIVMRYPHAYRVHYYEEDSPVGLDASVFQPTLDFQFKNDSPNYILIQTSWDLTEQTLNFKIFGTPDNRTVEISEPLVTNVRPAPAALYQDDPTLAKGVVRQVDWSAGGATASFTRIVKRNGETLYQDTFTSTYQPWRAIFLVGTKS